MKNAKDFFKHVNVQHLPGVVYVTSGLVMNLKDTDVSASNGLQRSLSIDLEKVLKYLEERKGCFENR